MIGQMQLVHWMTGMGSAPTIMQASKCIDEEKSVEVDANTAARKLNFSVQRAKTTQSELTLADVVKRNRALQHGMKLGYYPPVMKEGVKIVRLNRAEENLGRIASYLGKPICSDRLTVEGERVSNARMLVEMDVSQELPDTMLIEEEDGYYREQSLEYEWKPAFCEECCQIGHHDEKCGKAVKKKTSDGYVEKTGKQKQREGKEFKNQIKKQWRAKPVAEQVPVQKEQSNEQIQEQEDGRLSEQPAIQKEQIPKLVQEQQVNPEKMIDQEMEMQPVQKSRGK
ncbi:hypothetical protein A4A49_03920 [Nicotiana attenuata]|uniref:Uncharacterized protein n=1 Tax=Nicotiana attenuata TaxID=49451 RepID=A0A1J6IW79_NICAT|nr:hypothetical protein A4A49_03920 [Nicotiana attenuata]